MKDKFIQNPSIHRGVPYMDPEFAKARIYMAKKILEFLNQKRQQSHEVPPQKMVDLARRLEEGLVKSASSKEEYLNQSTLESRLHFLIKRSPMSNQNQQFSHANTSASIGTMIPTPGLMQTANSSLIGTSAVDNSVIANNNSNITSSGVNSGGFMSTGNGPSGSVHGTLSGGYQLPSSSFSISSGGNNMLTSTGVQRMASQMIPTPGFNSSSTNDVDNNANNQSFMNMESSNNIGAFQTGESAIVSQPMQQKQHVGGQNSRILHNIGGHLGGGIRSTLQQKSYGVSNGPLNGGLGMMGNNMMNDTGASEGYLTGTLYGNPPKPLQHHFDQHQRTVIHGDGYGIGGSESAGSGNLYASQMVNNQSLNAVSLQSMPKANSHLMTNQSNVHSTQQVTSMKPQLIDQSEKMNFQSQYSGRENLVNSHQHQQFHQSSHQFQRHQLQQKQQSQQHQHLLKNDIFAQSHLLPNTDSEGKPDTEHRDEGLHFQVPGPFQFSDMQTQLPQNPMETHSRGAQLLSHPSLSQDASSSLTQTSDQMQQLMHPDQFAANPESDLSGIVQPDTALQGQWYPNSQDGSHVFGRLLLDQNVHEDSRQGITGQNVAQQNNLSSEESIIGQSDTTKATEPPNVSGTVCRSNNLNRERQFKNQQRWLLFLRHARRCPAPEGKCQDPNCLTAQNLLKHMEKCNAFQCAYPRCRATKVLINHHRRCKDASCPVCVPVKNFVQAQLKAFACSDINSGPPNPVNGSCKSFDTAEIAGRLTPKTNPTVAETPEDLQPSIKRMKTEPASGSLVSESESSVVPDASTNGPHPLPNVHQAEQHHDSCMPTKPEVTEVKIEVLTSIGQGSSKSFEMKNDKLDNFYNQRPDDDQNTQKNSDGFDFKDGITIEKELDQDKQVNTSLPAETVSKSGKPTIKGVSMMELFTPEQVREHIRGLRQWVGQFEAGELVYLKLRPYRQKSVAHRLSAKLSPRYFGPFEIEAKPVHQLAPLLATGDQFIVEPKSVLQIRPNPSNPALGPEVLIKWKDSPEFEAAWELFDSIRHQFPAFHLEDKVDFKGGGIDRPPIQFTYARRNGRKARSAVPGAESLVVRVVSSVDKKLEVKPRFLEIFQEENYPSEFPYKSKVVLLFQKIEGVEVCLFGMYLQEFGSECLQPNNRRVYLSYLDSVKYFRPEVKAVTGEALRTFVYHEILIGYLEYCKLRGFTSCYIWACPPLKGEDYILYCHPEIQKTPKSDKLREWYLSMLRKAAKENIVVELTNLYDHFFVSNGECKAKVTAARLPYFDGDYWPGAAEDMIYQLQQEEDGRKQHKKETIKKTITKRALKASGQTDLSGNASKDLMLMHKLGETISPMKEDFIMVHLQHACTHCCILMVSGNRWDCQQCKNFQLCDNCYEAEQKREDRERHPIYQKDKHVLYPVEITDVTSDTKDKDEILESEFFDTRQAFLSLCQGNHYQYDTLRRAKHSSMMVLYHLHNPTAPAFVITCNVCHLDIDAGQGWHCETCPDYDVCNACYQKDGGIDHPHKLTNYTSNDRDAQNKEARQMRVMQLRKMLDLLVHASQCRSPHCQYLNCRKVKGLFRHGMLCKIRASGGCVLCKKMWYLLQLHARACKESECTVPRCRDLKEHMRRLQQQSDSRRRAAVMEMMRQRAAEVATNS
ncbi:histone acetyltransferase HAC1-like isoform X1 [Olea europaea subsp. europaea]|uniref:histone acetyltransferase n=1 Tax=Olea europaea subsp. europaea TaxID=158383 RepID=A0A8S0U338_OLEEU|nr:histone acetyltransferase HAC1-like isoform X1 [Olea europaea subsp. europaea]